MPPLAPKKPPVDAYPLLKPDKQREVDGAPEAERGVFSWLLLITGQEQWKTRQHPCIVCERSGWPCVDPVPPGARKRCEGCYYAGVQCQTLPWRRDEESSSATPSSTRTKPTTRSASRTKARSSRSHDRQRHTGSSEDDSSAGRSQELPTLSRRKRRLKRKVMSPATSPADSDSAVSGTPSSRRKSRKKSQDVQKVEVKQEESSDVEFVSMVKARPTPAPALPPIPWIPRREATQRTAFAQYAPPSATKTPAQSFQELLEGVASDDEDGSESSDSGPIPPRPPPLPAPPSLTSKPSTRGSTAMSPAMIGPQWTTMQTGRQEPSESPTDIAGTGEKTRRRSKADAGNVHTIKKGATRPSKACESERDELDDDTGAGTKGKIKEEPRQPRPSRDATRESTVQSKGGATKGSGTRDELPEGKAGGASESSDSDESSDDTASSSDDTTATSESEARRPKATVPLTAPQVAVSRTTSDTTSSEDSDTSGSESESTDDSISDCSDDVSDGSSSSGPLLVLDSSTELTHRVLRKIVAAANRTAHSSITISFNGGPTSDRGKRTLVIVPEAKESDKATAPWHLQLYSEERSDGAVVFKLPSYIDRMHTWDSDVYELLEAIKAKAMKQTIPRCRKSRLAVPKAPNAWRWWPCLEIHHIAEPLWVAVLAVWLSRTERIGWALRKTRRLKIREEHVTSDLNLILQGKEWSGNCLEIPTVSQEKEYKRKAQRVTTAKRSRSPRKTSKTGSSAADLKRASRSKT